MHAFVFRLQIKSNSTPSDKHQEQFGLLYQDESMKREHAIVDGGGISEAPSVVNLNLKNQISQQRSGASQLELHNGTATIFMIIGLSSEVVSLVVTWCDCCLVTAKLICIASQADRGDAARADEGAIRTHIHD